MSTIKENVATNIAQLRKTRQWTQAELAEMLCYSDKTISKWERGDSTPDVEMLYQLSQLFEVPIEYFFSEHDKPTDEVITKNKSILLRNIAKILLWIIVAWFIGTCIFTYQKIYDPSGKGYWLSFIWPVPVSFVIITVHTFRTKYFRCIPYSLSGFLWTFLASIYLQFTILDKNLWLIFLIGIPVQLIIIISYWLKK